MHQPGRFRNRSLSVPKQKSATDILRSHTGIDPATDPQFREIASEYSIARMIYDARTAAGLTQQSWLN